MSIVNDNLLEHLFWIMPLLLVLLWLGSRLRRSRLSALIADPVLAVRLTQNVSRARRQWRHLLFLVGFLLAAVAAMRPQWGSTLVNRPTRSRDVMVVFDVSRSMLAKDVPPSRLQHAKLVVRRVIEARTGDRFGLVAFAGSAFLECPLTQNRSGFMLFLDDLDTATIPVGGTNLERALTEAHTALQASVGRDRAVLLVTDGDELQGDVERVLEQYRADGIPIYIVGVGDATHGSFIQLPDRQFVVDEKGERVRSRLNIERLEMISRSVNGVFLHSTLAQDGAAYLAEKIRSLVPEEAEDGPTVRPLEGYQVPLLLALLLLLGRLVLGERRREVQQEKRQPEDALTGPVVTLFLFAMVWLGNGTSLHAQDLVPSPGPDPAEAQASADPSALAWRQPLEKLRIELESASRLQLVQALERLRRSAVEPSLMEIAQSSGEEGLQAVSRECRLGYETLQRGMAASRGADEQAVISYGVGAWLQDLGLVDVAATAYQRVLELAADVPGLKAAAQQNLGAIYHEQARAQLQEQPEQALSAAAEAERYYREALRQAEAPPGAARNQERLLALRREAERLIEMRKEEKQLDKQQQEASDQIDEARKDQQQANEAQNDKERRDAQQQASEKTQQAKDKLEEMAKQAQEQGLDEKAESLKDAAEKLSEAQKKQQEANDANKPVKERQEAGKEAEERLSEARDMVKPPEAEPGEDEPQDGEAENGEPEKTADAGEEDDGKEEPEPTADTQQPEDEGEASGESAAAAVPEEMLDKAQAEQLLQAIQENEKNLLKEIKLREMQQTGQQRRKDW